LKFVNTLLALSSCAVFAVAAASDETTSAVVVPEAVSTTDAANMAATVNAAVAESNVERISVQGVRERLSQQGRLQDVLLKTESLDADFLQSKNAINLTSALQDEPGVRVSNECSMCGAKRVMLNGMRGEHTTILLDGLPAFTMLSGFYALDAVATAGLARIDVARGAGASLLAPEAIGGTVNLVSKDATEDSTMLDASLGNQALRTLQLHHSGVSDDDASGWTLTAQHDSRDQYDADDNGVSETPYLRNNSLTTRLSHDFSDQTNTVLRLSTASSEVFGGPVLGDTVASIGAAIDGYDALPSDSLFVGDNVNQRFVGKAWETAEWVKTERHEAYNKWLHELNQRWSLEAAVSYANHRQDSFYEGIDYAADNDMWYGRLQLDHQATDQIRLTYGLDRRDEQMRSATEALSSVPAFVSDSFDYNTSGMYSQLYWQPTDQLDLSLALRFDQVKADFTDLKKPGTEIDQQVLAPRFDLRYYHNENWTSRWSVGRGYRAPLSFFESEHGILDAEKGFQIAVTELEQSLSANYALSFESDAFNATLSHAYTQVKHLASLEETADGTPVLSQLDAAAVVRTTDLALSWQLTEQLKLSATAEYFGYDDNFRASYAVAPVERRASLDVDYQLDSVDVHLAWVWFGSRDLTRYSYQGFDDAAGTVAKPLLAPAYGQLDSKIQWQLLPDLQLYVGGTNLLNVTQLGKHSSPLMYDAAGGYDVAYIFGQLQGRSVYAGARWTF
jgi:outer membrane receptor for ferrienterochelin and colicins